MTQPEPTTPITRPSTGGVPDQTLDTRPPTRLERAIGHHRAPSVVLLILLPLVCWSWIVVMARDMYGPMTGASVWMMTREWDARHLFLLWAMWAVMMAGMMLPSAAPLILLYGAAARRRVAGRRATCWDIAARQHIVLSLLLDRLEVEGQGPLANLVPQGEPVLA